MPRAIFPRGSRPVFKHLFSREKIHVFGALSGETFSSAIAEKLNTETYLQFVKHLMNLYGKIVTVIDSVSYHKSKKAKKFYEENEDRLKVFYFPKYSPKMNPTEQVWRRIKAWLATRIWFTKIELEEQLCCALNNRDFIVKIYDYLVR